MALGFTISRNDLRKMLAKIHPGGRPESTGKAEEEYQKATFGCYQHIGLIADIIRDNLLSAVIGIWGLCIVMR
jgi:hypothetical protein